MSRFQALLPADSAIADDQPGNEPALLSLRKRFMVWSMAIASSLTTTGAVTLRSSPAWAQEEPAAAGSDEQQGTAFNRREYNELLQAKKFVEAGEMLDAAMAAEPDNSTLVSLKFSLAVSQLRSDQAAGLAVLQQLYQLLLEREALDASSIAALSNSANYLAIYNRDAPPEENLQILDRALDKLESQGKKVPTVLLRSLISTKSRLLMTLDKPDEAKASLDGLLEQARQSLDAENAANVAQFLSVVSTYSSALADEFPAAVEQLQQEAESLAVSLLEADEVQPAAFAPYYNLMSSAAARLAYSNPKQAQTIVNDVLAQLAAFKEKLDEKDAKSLSRYETGLGSLSSRIESALAREELIGTTAPPFDAEHFVAMNEVTMDDMKGRVVLLDFWAVWCGPCIATFPHLIEWHEKYADQGLTIIGVTKFYGYEWDEEEGRASRGKSVPPEEELAMLDRFRTSYDLHHGFMVTPQGSEYSKAFQVTGIPQAVLIDKEGKIRMIRVGSGEANAKALDAKIEELLGG